MNKLIEAQMTPERDEVLADVDWLLKCTGLTAEMYQRLHDLDEKLRDHLAALDTTEKRVKIYAMERDCMHSELLTAEANLIRVTGALQRLKETACDKK